MRALVEKPRETKTFKLPEFEMAKLPNFFSRHIDRQHEAMFAYYTAARWFGITLDLVLCIFCVLVGLFELYTVKDSSTAGMNAY
jgi:hypothetical protein